jgi:transcriptional regulator with XRE-family HTH domain
MNVNLDEGAAQSVRAMGVQLRVMRKEQGLSIEELAKTAGVGAGTVSQYERGMGNPTVHTLRKLTDALGLPMSALASSSLPSVADLHGAPNVSDGSQWTSLVRAGRVDVVRVEDRRRLVLPGVGPSYEILSPDMNGALLVMLSVFRVGFDNFDQPFEHAGEEAITVTDGRLEGLIGGTSVVLEKGDTVTFDASLPHAWRTLGESDATLYSAITPPTLK